jgi:hypothetical protein
LYLLLTIETAKPIFSTPILLISAGPLGWWLSARYVLKRDPSNSLDHPSLRYGSQDDRYTKLCYRNHNHHLAFLSIPCVYIPGLAYSLYDGQKKQETLVSEDIRKNAVHNVPSFLEVMGFSFFPGSVLAGPQVST